LHWALKWFQNTWVESLNAEIIQALETVATEAERLQNFAALRKDLDRFAASLPPLDDSAPLIREDRER